MSVVSISLGFRGIMPKKCHLFTLFLFGYIFEHSSCNDVNQERKSGNGETLVRGFSDKKFQILPFMLALNQTPRLNSDLPGNGLRLIF